MEKVGAELQEEGAEEKAKAKDAEEQRMEECGHRQATEFTRKENGPPGLCRQGVLRNECSIPNPR